MYTSLITQSLDEYKNITNFFACARQVYNAIEDIVCDDFVQKGYCSKEDFYKMVAIVEKELFGDNEGIEFYSITDKEKERLSQMNIYSVIKDQERIFEGVIDAETMDDLDGALVETERYMKKQGIRLLDHVFHIKEYVRRNIDYDEASFGKLQKEYVVEKKPRILDIEGKKSANEDVEVDHIPPEFTPGSKK